MTSRAIASRLALTLLVVAFALPAFAQSAGNLRGTVTDETGNVVPDATVVLRSESTAFSQTQTSDDRGGFYFAAVTPGLYTIEASLQGFKSYKATGLRVGANDTLAVQVRLQVGEVVETINVVADRDIIATSTGAREGLITPDTIESMSIMNRSPLELIRILPGVVAPDPTAGGYDTVGISSQFGGTGNAFSINGARPENTGVTMDGANLRDIGNNSGMFISPNNEFVAEVKVQTSNYAAEFGSHVTTIQAVTKSGSADFHGSLYYYGRPYQLQANDRSRNWTQSERPKSDFKYPGMTLSGPIIIPGTDFNKDRDKAFFFLGLEYQKQNTDVGAKLGVVPTLGMRTGDFSGFQEGQHLGLGTNVRIPGGWDGAGTATTNLAPYATPTGLALMSTYPNPNYTDPDNRYNYVFSQLAANDRTQGILRVDYNISDNTRAYVRLARDKEAPQRYGGLWWQPNIVESPSALTQTAVGMSAVLNVTSVLSPTTTNEVIFAWSRLKNDNRWDEPEKMMRSTYGITDTVNPLNPSNIWIPDWHNNWQSERGSMWFAQDVENIFSYNGFMRIQDNLTKVLDTHALKFGVVVERGWKQQNFQHRANGRLILSTWGNGTTGNELGDLLTGRPSQVDIGQPSEVGMFVNFNIEAFAQDSWKVNKNLTLEYGVRFGLWTLNAEQEGLGAIFERERWDSSLPPFLNAARNGAWDPTTGEEAYINGVAYASLGDVGKGLTDSRPLLFMPRANFAYDVKGNGDTIVRGGAGLFYVREQGNAQYDIINVVPNSYEVILDAYSFWPAGSLSYGTLGDIDPFGSALAIGDLNTPNPYDLNWPYAWNASISIAQRLPAKHVLEIGYVGLWQRNMVAAQQQNVLQPGELNTVYSQDPLTRAAINDNVYNSLRPYEGLGNVRYPVYIARSNYNSLQATLSKQSGNLTYLLSYTLSKAEGHITTDFSVVDPFPDWDERNWGILNTDRTHVANFSWAWRLGQPIKEGGVLGFLLNDWNLSGISTYSSGQPYRPFFSGQLGGDRMQMAWWGTKDYEGGNATQYPGSITPTYSCDPNIGGNPGRDEAIWDINCLGIPGFGQTGPTYPPDTVRLPGKQFHDLTVFKDFSLGGSRRLQLRLGVFNIFNQAFADELNYDDIETRLDPACTQVSGTPNGAGGTTDNLCDPLQPFYFDDDTRNKWGTINLKHGHRTVEFAVRLFF